MSIFHLIRIGFASIFSYTFLNSVGVFKIPLTFPWLVILIPTIFGWWFWEKVSRKKLGSSNLTGGMIALLLSSELIGNTFGFFEKTFWYDKIIHLIGGLTAGIIICAILEYSQNKHNWNFNFKSLIIFSLALSIMFLVLWEFYEYFVDYIRLSSMISDRFDTVDDLLFGSIGAFISILGTTSLLRKREKVPVKQEFTQKP